jgi:16S rRNA (cytidine1402-2'-O)-methyltransferase
MSEQTAILYIVATPIGNLEDITLRALRILKEVDVVACEDTRTTGKLLAHYDIHTPTVSFHAHSGEKGFSKITGLLEEGKRVALVSDAGTPGVSDPGQELVSVVRERLGESVRVETIPGASALAAALSVAGMRAAAFTFYGFLPLKKGREKLFKEMAASERASVFYESPHRIHKSVKLLITFLQQARGEDEEISDKRAGVERRVGIFRELTKLHEDSFVGTPEQALQYLESDENHQRGEFVVIVEGQK